MNLSRTTLTAGLAALSLAVSAAPALAKGGDPNNTVISISPAFVPAPSATSGGGGSGRPSTCVAVGVDPVTGSILMSCTQNRV